VEAADVLLPTILIVAVNLALGFLAAVGREKLLALRAVSEITTHAEEPAPPAESAQPAATESCVPAIDAKADDDLPPSEPNPADQQISESSAPSPTPPTTDAAGDQADAQQDDESSVDNEPLPSVDVAAATASASTDLPAEWFHLLADIEKQGYGKCQSFVEASTQVLRLEVGRYRGGLVEFDNRFRALFENFEPHALATALDDLERINADWLARQNEALAQLTARQGQLGALQTTGELLEKALRQQTAQIDETRANLRQLDFSSNALQLRQTALAEINRLLDMAHALRDELHESMLAIVLSENRIATLDRRLHVDALTGFVNRTGLEVVLHEWQRDDPNRIRPLSLVALDVVGTASFNARHGAAASDAMLAAVGKIVDASLRRKRGCDVVARHSGQRFVVVMGDTGPQNATSAAERTRQVIAASTIELANENVRVNVSCGVASALAEDDSSALLERLTAAVSQANGAGRNKTCTDEGDGPKVVQKPPDFQVKGKVVRLQA
jgi:diguanylate cyclase (GGDEF)-like protein